MVLSPQVPDRCPGRVKLPALLWCAVIVASAAPGHAARFASSDLSTKHTPCRTTRGRLRH